MSNRQSTQVRTIHPDTLAEVGEAVAVEMLAVARDLRSGAIPPEEFDMSTACGTACCIWGHMKWNLNRETRIRIGKLWVSQTHENAWLGNLFRGTHPSDRLLAVDAIERYVYDHAAQPWAAP